MAIGTAAAIIGGSVIGAASSAIGASKSAKAARDAQQTATDAELQMYNQTRADFAPQRQLGYDALSRLNRLYGYGGVQPAQTGPQQPEYLDIPGLMGGGGMRIRNPNYTGLQAGSPAASGTPGQPDMGAFFESPDYQFNLGEGQKAIDRSAAARGGLLSGRAVKEGQRYASGLASREYSAFVDRLMQQAGLGSTGIGATAAAGQAAASGIGSAAINAGNMRGSAYMAGAQGVNNAFQGGLGNMMMLKYLGG